jgi:hypothetical protein
MTDPIQANDKRYEPLRNDSGLCGETFRDYQEAWQFIRSNCKHCQGSVMIGTGPEYNRRHKCDMLHTLKLGMANDFPFWSDEFVRLELREGYRNSSSIKDSEEDRLPDKLIACRKFNSKQLKFAFAAA